ncbi:glutathione S-transferase N-terminal domain-containing protein [Crenobacter cavernae]|uniref:Glutathione S-transferase n=1 Tax=Crenobacter cavernae TaxID=2290923 RepID=A0ABY0FFY0_9NEIS|nr:glutathione S-transferase N-terminal domain-containing protein [Crenobacter cavernae]RXZ45009.1 glutathione S-transferase [Crenobacter cavernae]
MKLIASLTSPFARKVRIALIEKKIDCPLEETQPWALDTVVPQYNPLGKVPVLVLDDGSAIFDSRVIVEYLDTISPVSRLFPQDTRTLLGARRWEALADGICEAAAAVVVEKRRSHVQQSPEWIARQQGKVERGVAQLSADLGDKLWCNGDAYGIADIAVGVCLGYLDFRFPELAWKERHPNLAALQQKLEARPSFTETLPPAI